MQYFKVAFVLLPFCLTLFACSEMSSQPPAAGSPQADRPGAAGLPVVDQPAPDFTLKDLDGRSHTLTALRGKVVIVNFWATWCPPCRAEMPSMEQLHRELSDEGLVLLAINIEKDGRTVVPRFLASSPHSFPILLDEQEEVQQRYGVYKFPESFIIRKDGIIDDKVIGAIDWSHPQTVAYFRSLLKE